MRLRETDRIRTLRPVGHRTGPCVFDRGRSFSQAEAASAVSAQR
jgi:hypothetical protein